MSAGDIYVEDGKVYVMYDGYYKINDEKTELEIIGDGNYPSCMTVHNGDVYVGGYYLNTDRFCPAYWRHQLANLLHKRGQQRRCISGWK